MRDRNAGNTDHRGQRDQPQANAGDALDPEARDQARR